MIRDGRTAVYGRASSTVSSPRIDIKRITPWQVSISISPRSATECRLKVQTRCVPVTSSTRNSSLWRTNHGKKFMKKITLSIWFFLKFSHMSVLLVDMGDHLSTLKRAVCQIFLLILKVCDRSWFGKLFVPWSGRSCLDSCVALHEFSTDPSFSFESLNVSPWRITNHMSTGSVACTCSNDFLNLWSEDDSSVRFTRLSLYVFLSCESTLIV